MCLSVVVILLLGTIRCDGQHTNENGSSCLIWYYNMPRNIECRAGTHFFTACKVKVPCDIETEVDWYWNPLNMPNKTLLITNSGSNGTHIRALPNATCSSNASTLITRPYILNLKGLNYSHVGYYWCQLKVVNYRGRNPVGELLPSNRCYVGIRDMAEDCDYGEHTDTWMCAQKESVTAGSAQDIRPTLSVMPSSPTISIVIDSGPSDNSSDHLIKMSVTILEMAFLVTIVICLLIIALLFCCLLRKHGKRREGTAVVDEINTQKQRSASILEDPNPRYTPVNTLTHTLSLPQLTTDWCRYHSNDATSGGEEAIYSSPYQHLSLDNLDYTNMYSKPHQHTEITARKSAMPYDTGL